MRTIALLAALLALAACADRVQEQTQIGEDRFRLALWHPFAASDEAAALFAARTAELCPQGHYVIDATTRNAAVGREHSWTVRCVDLSAVDRPQPRPPGGP